MTNNKVVNTTDVNFEQDVLNSDVPVVLDFWAQWCGPCKALSPTLDQLAEKYAGKVKIVKIDTESNPELCRKYRVRGIPHVLLLDNGEVVSDIGNMRTLSQLSTILDGHLSGQDKTTNMEANLDDLAIRTDYLLDADIDRVRAYLTANPGFINEPLQRGNKALSVAIRYKLAERVELFLEMGADTNLYDNICLGNLDAVKEIIEQDNSVLNPTEDGANSPLVPAIENGQKQMFDYLLSAGADINWKSARGDYPIYKAPLMEDDLDAIKWMKERGLDLKVFMLGGNTGLHLSAHLGFVEMSKYLLEQGIDPKTKNIPLRDDIEPVTALDYAKRSLEKHPECQEIIEMLEK